MTRRPPVAGLTLVALLAPTILAACGAGASNDPNAPVVVTFEVVDERYKVLLTQAADIQTARQLLDGADVPSIPNGRIVHECDGLPSDVETGVTGDRYCPWAATVIGIDPAG